MKSKAVYQKTKTKPELEFPVLMRHKSGCGVVLFIDSCSGIIVENNSYITDADCWELGAFSKKWLPADNEDEWELFNGTIELSN